MVLKVIKKNQASICYVAPDGGHKGSVIEYSGHRTETELDQASISNWKCVDFTQCKQNLKQRAHLFFQQMITNMNKLEKDA